MEKMTIEQMKKKAPSIFTTKPSKEVSDKYTHIPTNQIIEDMEYLNWSVVDVQEVRSRKNIGFQKHLVRFQNENIKIEGPDKDVVFPQILLTNSHDGKNSFIFQAGLFRLVCSNGLVISTQDFGKIKIRHMGYSFEELKTTIESMVNQLPLTVESMNKMKEIELEQKQILQIAEQALKVRFSEDELNRITVDMDDFIRPTRKEDESKDLWAVFNVVQEKIINGGFEYSYGNKTRKARKIKNFNQDQKLNAELFEVAYSYLN